MGLLEPNDYYILLEVFIFLAIAQVLRSSTKQIGVPEIVADLIVGMVLGSYALGGVIDQAFGIQLFVVNSGVLLFADLAVVLILFSAGLGSGFSSLQRAGGWVAVAAVAGSVMTFVVTFVTFSLFYPVNSALFIAIAVAPTSTVVTASLIQADGQIRTPGAQFLLNASALDDVVSLVLLSVALATLAGRSTFPEIVGTGLAYVVAWVLVLLASVVLLPRILKIPPLRKVEGLPFALLFGLIAIVLALGFSPIIGAYIAGLAIAESVVGPRTRELTAILVGVFGALFFIIIGAEFNVGLLLDPTVVGLAVLLTLLAALAKFAGVYPTARRWAHDDRLGRAIASGMLPRGEIGLVVGALGFGLGILTEEMLGEVLVASILTTLVGAFLFRRYSAAFAAGPDHAAGAPSPGPVDPS
ncbi:MAG TPA: cation:proton antiporter [Thermoplasmata archaeon]|nr:cation:proton antiporter [Thermoplasmata archaeon]